MSLFAQIFYRCLSALVAVSFVASSSSASVFDIGQAAYKGFTRQYTYEERAEMGAYFLFGNESGLLHTDTAEFAREVIYVTLLQFSTGNADSSIVHEAVMSLPRENIVRDPNVTYENRFHPAFVDFVNYAVTETNFLDELDTAIMIGVNGVHDFYIYLEETDREGIYMFMASFINGYREEEIFYTGTCYDSNTGRIFHLDEIGILGIGYDYNVLDFLVTNPKNGWMRKMGFNVMYDILGEAVFMDCETERIKFEYNGTKYMVQLWKGNYTSLTNGAEIGLYYLEDGRWFHYSVVPDEELADMSMALYHGDEMLYKQDTIRHWWISGFKPGPIYDHDDLRLEATIDFLDAERAAKVYEAGCNTKGMQMTLEGSAVNIIWQ